MSSTSVPKIAQANSLPAPPSRGFRSALSDLQTILQRSVWARAAGLSFDGRRDLYEVFGYPKVLSCIDFENKYIRNGLAKRIVEMPADASWADPPLIKADAIFQTAWDNLVTRQKLFFMLRRLDVLVGLGNFAVLLVGYDDGRPVQYTAANPTPKNVTYIQPYGESAVGIVEFDRSPQSPRFGLPTMYEIQPGEVASKNKEITTSVVRDKIRVHWTRILHVAENVTDNPIIGHSRLEAVYNYLNDLEKVSGGSAEVYWLTANRGMHIDIDKEMDLDPDSASQLADEIDEYVHQQRRFIRTRGVKIENLGSDPSDPSGTLNSTINLISGTTGIPQRILIGSEAGQLASEQDRANWSQRVQERIANFASPVVLMPFIEMQIRNNALPVPTTMTVEWPDAFKLSPLERGQASAQMARSAANLVKALTTPIALDGSGVAVEDVQQEVTDTVPDAQPPAQAPGGPNQPPGKVPPGNPPAKPAPRAKANAEVTRHVPAKNYKPSTTLFTVDEARQIVGFGKHAPVFDDKQDSDPTNKTPVGE